MAGKSRVVIKLSDGFSRLKDKVAHKDTAINNSPVKLRRYESRQFLRFQRLKPISLETDRHPQALRYYLLLLLPASQL
jgi:hypothetical protein